MKPSESQGRWPSLIFGPMRQWPLNREGVTGLGRIVLRQRRHLSGEGSRTGGYSSGSLENDALTTSALPKRGFVK